MPKPAPRGAARAKKRPAAKQKSSPKKAPQAAAPATAPSVASLARALKLPEDEVLRRALHAFAAAHGVLAAEPAVRAAEATAPARPAPTPAPAPAAGAEATDGEPPALAPAVRLYVHSNGRTPQEMIRDRYFIGSSPKCDLWVNSPKIETRHLQIVREGDRYFAEDLDTEAGTVFDGQRLVGRHEIGHDDRLFLAGYHQVRFYLLS